jgi:hypothetical protein
VTAFVVLVRAVEDDLGRLASVVVVVGRVVVDAAMVVVGGLVDVAVLVDAASVVAGSLDAEGAVVGDVLA